MHILITNDDGINSKGIRALRKELRGLGELSTIAPDREKSATGHSLTLIHPIRVEQIGRRIYAIDGTPSDCVNLGVMGILDRKVDLVVSGINNSPNLGDDVTYSGTVSAAMEGTLLGIPSFAVSVTTQDRAEPNFTFAAKFARQVAIMIKEKGLPDHTLLNINVPNVEESKIKGVAITKQGKRTYREELINRIDPRGRVYYWIGSKGIIGKEEDGSDFKAISENKISITPLHLDLTNYVFLKQLKEWDIKL
ncbi:MAG: 5'/3'-nucleotidase SurE [bacterium]|nr:5'/3'-nucleotidase SurE [bacterium]